MRFIKKEYLFYEIYGLISVFVLLILAGLLKFLFRTFSLYLEDRLDFEFTFLIALQLYFLLTPYLFIRSFKHRTLRFSKLFIVFIINCLVFFTIGLITSNASWFVFLTTVTFYVLIPFSLSYHVFLVKKKLLNKLVFLLCFVLIIFLNYKIIHPVVLQQQNYGSISGTYSKAIDIESINFKNEDGDIINLDKDIIYLDFWNNTCGVCIKKFPIVENVATDLNGQSFYLVNVIEDESQIETAKNILNSRNVNVQNIFLHKQDLANFDVYFYPTVIKIVEDEIVFKGSIETLNYFNLIEGL